MKCFMSGGRTEGRSTSRAGKIRQQSLRLPQSPPKAYVEDGGGDDEDADERETRVCEVLNITRQVDRAVRDHQAKRRPHRCSDQQGNESSWRRIRHRGPQRQITRDEHGRKPNKRLLVLRLAGTL